MSVRESRSAAVAVVTAACFTDIVAYSIAVPVLPDLSSRLAQLLSDGGEQSPVIETRLRVECCCGRTLRRDFVVVGNRDRWD